MKKILFVEHETMIGGSTVSLGYLIKRFSAHAYAVAVSSPKAEEDRRYFSRLNAEVIPCNPFHINTLALDLHFTSKEPVLTFRGMKTAVKNILKLVIGIIVFYRTIKKYAPDFVYVNEYVLIQASIAAKLAGIPCGMHIRSLPVNGRWGIRRAMLTWAIPFFNDVVFPISKTEAEPLRDRSLNLPPNVVVVGEFLDEENYRPHENPAALREKLMLPPHDKIILMLGGMAEIKGTLDFLKAARVVLNRRSDVYFLIAGKEYRVESRAYAETCDALMNDAVMKTHARSLGVVADPIALLACCDVLVSPTTMTHFSRPVIEAWAMKKPVVVTATRHSMNLVTDECDGVVVPIGDPNALAEAVLGIVGDDARAQMLGENGFTKAAHEYDAAVNTEIIITQCEEVLSQSLQNRRHG
jgi:glycosyltransferase involved in cell wall biosynthesis